MLAWPFNVDILQMGLTMANLNKMLLEANICVGKAIYSKCWDNKMWNISDIDMSRMVLTTSFSAIYKGDEGTRSM